MKRILVYLAFSATAGLPLIYSDTALALVPSVLTQQGRLLDSQNLPVTTTQQFVFSIYDAPSGGNLLWTETQTVTLDDGYFSARLGEITPIPFAFAGGATRYLGVKVGTDAEMVPRQALTSVPYALLANNAVGDITPSSITVGGTQIIDQTGHWIGPSSGLVGPAGPKGDTGPTGAAGPAGSAGAVGPAGPAGPKGDTGLTGATGAVGPAGPAGPAGAAGAVGPAGPAGAAGAVGPVGPTGAAGAVGPVGPAGLAGTNGAIGPIGPQGPAGATGAEGPVGPAGPAGAQGIQGIVGPQGPAGPQGPLGPVGATGAAGPTGPSGVVSAASSNGAVIPPTATLAWITPTVTATVAAGQFVHLVTDATLGSSPGANGLNIYPCYAVSGATAPSSVGGGMFGLTVPAASRQTFGVSAVISGLAAGTYIFGMCGNSVNTNWNNNDYGYTSVLVAHP